MRFLFLTLFLVFCFSTSAQVDAFQEEVITYLKSNGTTDQYREAYDGIFTILKKQFNSASVPDAFWIDMQSDKEKSVEEAIAFLSFAYRKHFTREDISKMTTFYNTEAAQKMLSKDAPLSSDESEAIAAFFESDIAKKIEEKQEALAIDIADISEHWSRDLFAAKMSLLVKAGFTTQQ
ncbi:DUF2059 domain-containing protein [Ulvibacter sp. MAR_2010_11]|uniref:DUF2059 domain-containing protein n=1 Tax=Ulvibacter sp. MAR_2010_11 TaxID=1250229 RepID=UPI001E45A387|nr:DUF2059 domain-containing protein [Ulvibacter sp. MAR_2010_11]